MTTKTALILGGSGQDGAFLAEALLKHDVTVFSLSRSKSHRMSKLGIYEIEHEVTNELGIEDALRKCKPDIVINLISMSSVAYCELHPNRSRKINFDLVQRLSKDISSYSQKHLSPVRFIQASSSEMFGYGEQLCDEETPLNPVTTYGLHKKKAHEFLVNQTDPNVENLSAILFNHESEYRSTDFVSAKVAAAAAEVAVTGSTKLEFGNIDSQRDWGFAGDYMDAVAKICLHGKEKSYVIASGRLHSVREMLRVAFNLINVHDFERHIKLNSKFVRRLESPPIIGNTARFLTEFGAIQKVDFEQTVHRMVQFHIEKLRRIKNV